MVKVLIAEDEYLVRIGLHTCIDWESNGFVLLNDAVDGLDAYQKIYNLRPDIVLLDLNMPKMAGLDILKKLQEDDVKLNVIVVSCYDDFENVRAAFRYGAVDYINKLGMTSKELLKALVRASPVNNTAAFHHTDGSSKPDGLLRKIVLSGTIDDNAQTLALADKRLLYMITVPDKQQKPIAPINLNAAQQIIKNTGVEPISCIDGDDNICIALPSDCDSLAIATLIRQHLEPMLNCRISIGFSPLVHCAGELLQALELAKQIKNDVFWGRKSIVRSYSTPLCHTEEQLYAFKCFRRKFNAQLNAQNLQGILSIIDEYHAYYNAIEDFPHETFRKQSLKLISRLNTENENTQTDAYFHFQADIVKAHFAEQIYEAMQQLVQQLFINCPIISMDGYSEPVRNAIDYMIDHPQKMIQLSEIAKLVNVSESYFGQLFKKETGMSFITYEHRYKINMAKQMLDDSVLVYEVCERVGFENGNYFAKIFKRFMGVSPAEYRDRNKNK